MNDQFELYENARKRVSQKRLLYIHIILFFIGSIALLILDILLEKSLFGFTNWSYSIILFWSLLILLHVINVFIINRFMGKDWQKQQLQKLVDQQERKIKELTKSFERDAQFKAEQVFTAKQKKIMPKQFITIIAAIAKDNALGKNNDLIWHLPADLKRFKKITSGHHIIMGRNTYESIGKPLPNRTTIIITRNKNYKADGCIITHSLEEAIKASSQDRTPFIIGGAQIYNEAIKIADQLDITEVHNAFEADAFFPKIDKTIWTESSRENFKADEQNQFDYSFISYTKK